MFMGAVAPPNDEHDFNGCIFLKRVAKERRYTRTKTCKRFSSSADINKHLSQDKDGWRIVFEFYEQNITIGDLKNSLKELYNLSSYVEERLTFSFHTHEKKNGIYEEKVVKVSDDDIEILKQKKTENTGIETAVTPEDINLSLTMAKGDTLIEDITCNSNFMLDTMPTLGKSIRDKMHWVSKDIPIYLVMDNAGGHGTVKAIGKYVRILKDKYNVIVKHQIPHSPETNLLDLGTWMSLQSRVENIQHSKVMRPDTLAESVLDAWKTFSENREILKKITTRWEKVLDLIIKDNGGNDLVESERGLTSSISDQIESDSDSENELEDIEVNVREV